MKIIFLSDVLTDELQDIKSAETQLQEVLLSFREHIYTGKVRALTKQYESSIAKHLNLLERCANELRISLEGHECQGMAGLITEGQHALRDEVSPVTDLLLIGALRRICHYKLVAYDTAIFYAHKMRKGKVAKWLLSCQREEQKLDQKLVRQLMTSVLPKTIGKRARSL